MRKQDMFAILLILSFLVTLGMVKRQPNESFPVLIPTATPKLVTFTESPVPTIDKDEFECLRANIYFEARTETTKGMEAVAIVTVNRSKNKHYPDTICGVVQQYAVMKSGRKVCQFSWMCDGKRDTPNLKHVMEARVWDRATVVAEEILQGRVHNFLGQATHYHASYVNPSWAKAKRFQQLTKIGVHIFYKDKGLFRKA